MPKQKITIVEFEEYAMIDFKPPSTFYIRNSLGQFVYIHTSSRATAQEWVDENYGKGRYTVNASKIQKTKSKQEGGGYTCTGVATRKGQQR